MFDNVVSIYIQWGILRFKLNKLDVKFKCINAVVKDYGVLNLGCFEINSLIATLTCKSQLNNGIINFKANLLSTGGSDISCKYSSSAIITLFKKPTQQKNDIVQVH